MEKLAEEEQLGLYYIEEAVKKECPSAHFEYAQAAGGPGPVQPEAAQPSTQDPPVPSDLERRLFLLTVREVQPRFVNASDDLLLDAGISACVLRQTMSRDDVIDGLYNPIGEGLSGQDIAYIVVAADKELCPDDPKKAL